MLGFTPPGIPRINRVNPFPQAVQKAQDADVRIRSKSRCPNVACMNPIHSIFDPIRAELGVGLSSTLVKLLLASVLGGAIGLERQLRHKPAGLRTNMFICFGAAMFTILSRQLAGVESDSARIAAQIIPGIGFIGAGSILHARASVTGLTTAATLFVVASVGMAAGGGLYWTALLATVVILVSLVLLGRAEAWFALKMFAASFEVTGPNVDGMLREVNRLIDTEQLTMQSIHIAEAPPNFRLVFSVNCEQDQQQIFSIRLHESNAFATVTSLGVLEHE